MATESYKVTIEELSRDYKALRENWGNNLSNFTFDDYCKHYFSFLESEESQDYTDLDDLDEIETEEEP